MNPYHLKDFRIFALKLEKGWQPTAVFLPGKSHGCRSLVGYSSWGHKESDTTERLHFLLFFTSLKCGKRVCLQMPSFLWNKLIFSIRLSKGKDVKKIKMHPQEGKKCIKPIPLEEELTIQVKLTGK